MFSTGWPYVVFSGLKPNCIFIINAYDTKLIHRVHLVDEATCQENSFKIIFTATTSTYDILIMTRFNEFYQLYLIKMDHSNIDEQENINTKSFFKPEILLRYDPLDVNFKDFKQLHARGSSQRDRIDTNQKLMIFIVHGDRDEDTIYEWAYTDNHESKLEFVDNMVPN